MSDDATGFHVAPARYSAKGRETIDRIRDALGGADFYAYCIGAAMKYEDRAGLKGPAEEDEAKARWYRQMAASVIGLAKDPRAYREDFTPYTQTGSQPGPRGPSTREDTSMPSTEPLTLKQIMQAALLARMYCTDTPRFARDMHVYTARAGEPPSEGFALYLDCPVLVPGITTRVWADGVVRAIDTEERLTLIRERMCAATAGYAKEIRETFDVLGFRPAG